MLAGISAVPAGSACTQDIYVIAMIPRLGVVCPLMLGSACPRTLHIAEFSYGTNECHLAADGTAAITA